VTIMEFREHKLDNGLTVLAELNPAAAAAAVGFFVRTGSRDETPDVWGVSHFLEHMMFKGNDGKSAHEFNLAFDNLGANYNAATSQEKTVYYGAVLSEHQHEMMVLLSELLQPALRQDDFDVEKQVILDEIALYEDQPTWRVYRELMAAYFDGHPLGHDVLGTDESVGNMTREGMAGYFRRRYVTGSMILVGTGHVDFDALVTQAEGLAEVWPAAQAPREHPAAPDHRERKVLTDPNLQRQHVGLMSPAPSEQHEERYAAQLACSILGDVTHSRLFYSLIEPAIAEDAQIIYEGLDGVGAAFTYISCDPDRTTEALDIARKEYETFQAEGPTEAELSAAKNKLASGATLASESPMTRLMGVGNDWVYRHGYTPLEESIDELMGVSRQDVQEVTRQWDLSAMSLVTLGPLESL